MSGFDPKKLHVDFIGRENNRGPVFPRKYTFTHSDITGGYFLSIGPDYDYGKFSGLYSRIMRDEVLGEWRNPGQVRLDIYCLVSGGIAIGPARWRKSIFEKYMNTVLRAIFHGDRFFIKERKDFLGAPIYVHFQARSKKADSVEKWGTVGDFMPGS